MSNDYSSEILDELDDYPKVTQADLDRATFRVGLKPAPRKQRVTIMLDTGLVEYFKARAGERGYQTLINETLRQAVQGDELEERLRRIIREEMHREAVAAPAAP
ncbi:MAG: BrnA antitoxin family protein [Caldilinea sp.]